MYENICMKIYIRKEVTWTLKLIERRVGDYFVI